MVGTFIHCTLLCGLVIYLIITRGFAGEMLFRYPQRRKCALSSSVKTGPGLHRKLQITAQTVHRNVKEDENPQSQFFAVKIYSVHRTDVSHIRKRSLYYTVCIAGRKLATDLNGKHLQTWANPPSKWILVPTVRFHPFKRQLCLHKFGEGAKFFILSSLYS